MNRNTCRIMVPLAVLLLLAAALPLAAAQVGTASVDTIDAAKQRLAEGEDDILVVYIEQEGRTAILQTGPMLGEDEIAAIIQSHEPRMRQEGRETVLQAMATEIAVAMNLERSGERAITELAEAEIAEEPPAPPVAQASSTCGLLKDGICESACPLPDLDCQCGDSVCQDHETTDTCPADCRPAKNYLCTVAADNRCDPECPGFDIDCEVVASVDTIMRYYEKDDALYTKVMTVLAIVIVLLAGLSIWLMHDIYNIRLPP
jgi:hypothetical protein